MVKEYDVSVATGPSMDPSARNTPICCTSISTELVPLLFLAILGAWYNILMRFMS
jgi:hypothetical protein